MVTFRLLAGPDGQSPYDLDVSFKDLPACLEVARREILLGRTVTISPQEVEEAVWDGVPEMGA